MSAAIDRRGHRFGRLVAICRVSIPGERPSWRFRCDCGVETVKRMSDVTTGRTRSCGCLSRETAAVRRRTHGHAVGYSASPTLRAWNEMKKRCLNRNAKRFQDYGGRGITICDRWLSFENFLEDMGERPAPNLSLDRIDNDGDYEPNNCRWATNKEQCRNQRKTVFVQHEGKSVSLAEFAEIMGVNYWTLHWRVRRCGHDPHEASVALRARKELSGHPTTHP